MKYLTKRDRLPFTKQEFRDRVTELEKCMRKAPGVLVYSKENKHNETFAITHFHFPGIYMRSWCSRAGYLVISKIHKIDHPYFVMSGEASVLTERGLERIKAPYYGITLSGTKRVLYIHKDTQWITVHATEETDVPTIESQIHCDTYEEYDRYYDLLCYKRKQYLLNQINEKELQNVR